MALKESGEMYLETIYVLMERSPTVRSIDIAEHLGYSKPSVSRAVGLLKQSGYITVDKDGYITLTEAGKDLTEKLYERHTILTKFLTALGVDEATAADDACRIEHIISEKSFRAMKAHLEEKED